MADLLPFTEVAHLFQDFEHTAWRLESQQGYASDRESPKWARWKAGQDLLAEPADEWRLNVAKQVALGKRFERVRIVDAPPTEGQRFLLASGLGNVAAGEDIRNLDRLTAARLRLPTEDFWVFDSRLVVRFAFTEAGEMLGVTTTEAAEDVLQACQVRDAAWHHAVRTAEYQSRVPSDA
ncbi:DUF6879 family protein [Streptomyces sp. NPDC001054]